MSSLRKLHQKSYKERSAPTWHRKGFLQKKKDYVIRAADYHRKQEKIKKLKEKAFFKNRDEFRGQMVEQKVRAHFTKEEEKLFQSQDIGYVTVRQTAEMKKIERLQNGLHMVGENASAAKHTVFVDSQKEVEEFDPVEYFDTVPEAVNRTFNRPKKQDLESQSLIVNKRVPALDQIKRQKERQYTELRARMKRSKQMKDLISDLTIRKALVTEKRPPQKIVDEETGRVTYKWRRVRKQ